MSHVAETVTATPVPRTREERLAQLAELYATPRHRPSLLDQAPRPSRIKPGRYACRVSKEYKLRDCWVEVDPKGHVMLEVGKGNLIATRGVLYNDGDVVRFEGWPTEQRPFGCFSCQERCFVQPDTCACRPRPAERIAGCLRQPLHAVFRGQGHTWHGVMVHRSYYDEYVHADLPSPSVTSETGLDRFSVELRWLRP